METANIVKEWSPSEIDLLIHCVRENADLYDQSRPGYSNLNVIDKCWRSIAERFSRKNEKLCKSKWQVLRGSYRTKRHENFTSVSGSAAKKVKKWAYFDAMSFLEKHMAERKTSTNIIVSSPNTEANIEENVLSPETGLLVDSEDSNTTMQYYDQAEISQIDPTPESSGTVTPVPTPTNRKRASTSDVEQSFMKYLDRKKPKTAIRSFLESMEEDMEKLSAKSLRRFKLEMLTTLGRYLDEEEEND